MHPDGVCRLPGGLYTKTVEYEDINYSVASTEDQTAIFGGWSSFLNYFDSSLPFQLSFINRRSHSRSRYRVNIPQGDDDFNSIREEYTGMLKNQIAKSNNGIVRTKLLTFGVNVDDLPTARARLENAGFTFRTVGNGETVTAQTPEGGAIVPNNASIVLYLGEEKNNDLRAVPNVIGMTAAEANQALTNAGFIMRVTGATSTESGNVKAISQDRGEGTELVPGSVVTVRFGDSSVRD